MILSSGRSLLGLAGLLVIGALAFRNAKERAVQSARMRKQVMVRGVVAVIVGALFAFWLPHRVPETSGSPASLVLILVLWIIGGGLLFLGVASLLGAAVTNGGPQGPAGPAV